MKKFKSWPLSCTEQKYNLKKRRQSPATIRLLLSTYDFGAATEYIDSIREVLGSELSGISSLRLLNSELDALEKQLNMMLVDEASNIFEVQWGPSKRTDV